MAQISAGLLMCRFNQKELEYFLVHPGGPFFKNKNEGWWTIPKGLVQENETELETAIREFYEETGIKPVGPYHPLGSTRLKSGKIVHAWAFTGSWTEKDGLVSNTFPLEWPPRSKKMIQVPEIDQARWMSYDEGCRHINERQKVFLEKAKELSPVLSVN